MATGHPWHALVEAHLSLVETIARRLKCRVPRAVEVEELRGAGHIGLVQAARNYRPTNSTSFATYASHRIWGAMLDSLRKNDHIDRMTRIRAKRGGTDHELPVVVSIEEHGHNAHLRSAPNGCPVTHASDKEWPAVYHGLTPQQRTLIDLRYRHGLTLRQIGIRLGFSESRASQLHQETLTIWRQWIETREQITDARG